MLCSCGSGEVPHDMYDARGIYCGCVCDRCEEERRKEFRPEIFTDPGYEVYEPIEPE